MRPRLAHRTPKEQALHSIARRSERLAGEIDHQYMMIRAAHTEGASLREIADATRLSHMTIKRIITDRCRGHWRDRPALEYRTPPNDWGPCEDCGGWNPRTGE